jgi:hypothetical protein
MSITRIADFLKKAALDGATFAEKVEAAPG